MREIKFRAWDTETRVILPTPSGTCTLDWDHQLGHDMRYPGLRDRYILMQYTGLHDKNGKEIYEGDVLKSPKTFDIGPVVYDVELDGGPGFIWNHPMMYVAQMDECEVVGNIYENPEMMK